MYCSNCGTEIKQGEQYCSECGTRVEEFELENENRQSEINVQQAMTNIPMEKMFVQRKEVRTITLFQKIVITELILFFVLVFAGSSYVKKLVSPEHIAGAYFEGMTKGNFDFVYEKTQITETPFLTKEMFKKYAEPWDEEQVASYDVQCELEEPLDPDRVVANIVYRNADELEERTYYLILEKQQEKKYFFFDKWEVMADHLMEEECTVCVPKGATVTVGGITLNSSYKTIDESEYDEEDEGSTVKYELPTMFRGTYDIRITKSGMQDYQGIVESEDDLNIYSLNYEEGVIENLQKQAGKVAMVYLQALAEKSKFSVMEEFVTTNREIAQEVKESYNMALELREDIIRVDKLNVYNVSSAVSRIDNDVISFEVSYEYDEEYVTDDFWFDEWEEKNEEEEGLIHVRFRQEDGEWGISSIIED